MKNILITGGLGYVGGRVAYHLASSCPDARIFLTTSKRGNAVPFWARSFPIIEMDLGHVESINKCIQFANFDSIVHLAALNEIVCLADPLQAYHINTLGTYHLANAANLSGIKRIIYFSTFHVYGSVKPNQVITETTPTFGSHPYATTHRAAEDILTYFKTYQGLNTLVFRLSNGFGYPIDANINRWTLVVNDLCRQAVTQGKMVLKTSGRQHRDFIALADIARAVELFLYDKQHDWGDGIYNLGGDQSMSIIEVAKRIATCYEKRFNKRLELIVQSDEAESEEAIRFSIEKLKAFGFKPIADMDKEILGTLEVCNRLLSEPTAWT